MLKARHGCNQSVFVRSDVTDWNRIGRLAKHWTNRRYGYWLDEWLYVRIPRGLLVEPFIGTNDVLPIDYKFYVFGGRVAYVQVHLHREAAHRWIVFDRRWQQITRSSDTPDRPRSLGAMIDAAEQLARHLDFVRIDFYEVASTPLFGEMTFYPGSGLDCFDPPGLDAAMGLLWRDASAKSDRPISDKRPL